ncbi:hypothetical protein CAMRE0001_3282 [Campylobacter rectus RM3267]|uniref:Uncharacterized protein n=1 Tax=Campylobacter rectus RM3267 TaxID=553218 RepID=B9D5U9_CAMRE|nr:hypothetical protein CAMRE0001_3282 [Campylobacter rectus RM3267]
MSEAQIYLTARLQVWLKRRKFSKKQICKVEKVKFKHKIVKFYK